MTRLLDEELNLLGVQPKPAAWRAGQAVRNHWFVGDFLFCEIVKRNFDIGADDGFITPWLIRGVVADKDETPELLAVPSLSGLRGYGFSARLEIEPKEWERKEILEIVYPSREHRGRRIEPARHFARIVGHIRAQAVQRYGPYVDDHELPSRRMTPPLASRPAGPGDAVVGPTIAAGASFVADEEP